MIIRGQENEQQLEQECYHYIPTNKIEKKIVQSNGLTNKWQ